MAAGDAVRQKLVEREEFNAQHGDCKILVRNGERLDEPLIVKPAAKGMKPRLLDVEWVAFAAIFALPHSYFGHHSHRKFSRIKTNILMVLHASHRPTKVRSRHRRLSRRRAAMT